MGFTRHWVTAAALLCALGCAKGAQTTPEIKAERAQAPVAEAPATAPSAEADAAKLKVPVDYRKLPNGLRVVLSRDPTVPVATIAVYYNIGFRIEPRNRTGFAHLFEHMMFQGSANLGKMEFIRLVQKNGGTLNGSTRFDYTNYFETVPSHTVETMLWAEADRMRGLQVTEENLKNQQGVVKNEVRVNVLNRPYGGFPWLDMPQLANTNWYNAHNFYGDLKDLDAATLEDVREFFKTYYAPNNAVLAVVGDFEPEQTFAWIQKYFGDIPSAPQPPKPDISEPRQEKEKRVSKDDPQANKPALAVGYHMPPKGSPEFYAMVLIDQLLVQGRDSHLSQNLVLKRGLAGEVYGGINSELGNAWNYAGPMQFMYYLFHDSEKTPDEILAAAEESIEALRNAPVDPVAFQHAQVKARSALYSQIEMGVGFGKADLLASYALFEDNPHKVNELEAELLRVTPELVQKTAQEYLRPTNRTILTIVPKKG